MNNLFTIALGPMPLIWAKASWTWTLGRDEVRSSCPTRLQYSVNSRMLSASTLPHYSLR